MICRSILAIERYLGIFMYICSLIGSIGPVIKCFKIEAMNLKYEPEIRVSPQGIQTPQYYSLSIDTGHISHSNASPLEHSLSSFIYHQGGRQEAGLESLPVVDILMVQ